MLRLLVLGILFTTLGVGFQKGWIEIHWDLVQADLGLPLRFDGGLDPFRSYSKPTQER
jgi:hypothetical protein